MRLTSDMPEVLAAIDSEIRFQHHLRNEDVFEPVTTAEGYLLLLEHYAELARGRWVLNNGAEKALAEVRKIAALAIRCLDEHGVQSRCGFDQPTETYKPGNRLLVHTVVSNFTPGTIIILGVRTEEKGGWSHCTRIDPDGTIRIPEDESDDCWWWLDAWNPCADLL